MIKYSIFLALVFGTSIAAFAAMAPHAGSPPRTGNVTVIHKTEAWQTSGPITVKTCAVDDCSDTPQS